MIWTEEPFYWTLLVVWVALGVLSFSVLLLKPAPYGRHSRPGWGPRLGPRWGWVLMECPAPLVFLLIFGLSGRTDPVSWVFLALWLTHYGYRGFIYPLWLQGANRVPLFIIGSGFAFNVVNGYLQARYLFHFAAPYPWSWLTSGWFLAGMGLFASGWLMVVWTDNALRRLRAQTRTDYAIPRGGLFRWVSCPHYLGEGVEWTGWALLTMSPAGAGFAFWTLANLLPRALAHHRWYREQFDEYPAERRAMIPYLL